MKKSGFCTIFHVYLIFFLSMLGIIIAAISLFYLLITVKTPNGNTIKSNWPKAFTENFSDQIVFVNDEPQVKQTGLESLQQNKIGLQILEHSGDVIYSYQKPEQAKDTYTFTKLQELYQTGQLNSSKTTAFIDSVNQNGTEYTYILYFPVKISKINMYLNGDRFSGGKMVILILVAILFIVIILSGIIYGFWTTKIMKHLMVTISEISTRRYIPLQAHGSFKDIYDSLNVLDSEIKKSDRIKAQTEKMQEEWISNITHDLKGPLAPIKGYAELLLENDIDNEEQRKRYAKVMLKNVTYIETLIHDLKLTYQLKNGMIPLKRQEINLVRFLKELIIDILNIPGYEHRSIHYEANVETILFSFDETLFTRVFHNLILNAFVHGNDNTEVTLQIISSDSLLKISVIDNGRGIASKDIDQLFQRYYRGINTEQMSEGTGLGLAISKNIVELHGGTICVTSEIDVGTSIQLQFTKDKTAHLVKV